MRLSRLQVDAINLLAKKYFADDAEVYLFGSRVDDNQKGGDIDLFIGSKNTELLNLEKKVLFLTELKKQIGDQKIDVVFDTVRTRARTAFYNSIVQHAVLLF